MKLKQLSLSRSGQMLLQNISTEIPGTGVTVLLGANGAGKSTLLRVLAGISAFDSGDLKIFENTTVCLMPEPAVFYPQLSVQEQLHFVAQLYQQENAESGIEAVLELWQLGKVRNQLTKHLSLGYRQRLSLAQLSISDADVWLLDEPMNGMDPEVMHVFKQQIQQLKSTKAVVMATHILHEAQDMADWVVVMHRGSIIHSEAYDNNISFHELYQQALQSYHYANQ